MADKKTNTRTRKAEVVKTPVKTKADLKAEAFVREYTSNGYNATRAYKLAVNPDVKPNSAASEASKLVRTPKVQALLSGTAERAKGALDVMVTDSSNYKHFEAVKLALAYEYGTPVSKSENVNVNVTLEDILLG